MSWGTITLEVFQFLESLPHYGFNLLAVLKKLCLGLVEFGETTLISGVNAAVYIFELFKTYFLTWSAHFVLQIEERIEEITQEEYADGENGETSSNTTSKSRESRRRPLNRTSSSVDEDLVEKNVIGSSQNIPELDFLNAWDLVEERGDRVPFPEFGIDFVVSPHEDFRDLSDQEDGEEECEVGTRPSTNQAWEKNWLFRKKKLFPYGSLRHQLLGFGEAPCLLIPNSQDSNAHAQIDSR